MLDRYRAILLHPTAASLRRFGFTLAAGFPSSALLWFLLVRWASGRWNWAVPLWIVGIGCPLGLLFAAAPALARPFYLVWQYLIATIDLVVSTVLLTAMFFLVITPVGLAMRAFGRQPLPRGYRSHAASFWKNTEPISNPRRYFRQF